MGKHRYIMEMVVAENSCRPNFVFREVEQEDYIELGELLYSADLGTVDDEGLPVEDSIQEIRDTLKGKYGNLLKGCSLLAIENSKIVAATIFTFYEKSNQPLLAFTMTHPQYKNKGYCQQLLRLSSDRLSKSGYKTCFLAVNAANLPAVAAYKKVGFVVQKEEH